MGLRSTFRPQIGPFAINTGREGVTSISARLAGVTFRLWDRKGRRGVSSIDLPGPISLRPDLRRRPQQAEPQPGPWSLNPNHHG